MFIDMWMIFIDPLNKGFVNASDIRIVFEELARGRYTRDPTLISQGFSNAMTYLLQSSSDINSEEIRMDKVRETFEDTDSEVNLLYLINQTLKTNCEYKGITEVIAKILEEKRY